jgi:hypothetical protein
LATFVTSDSQARFTSLDFALVYIRDADFFLTRSSLLTNSGGKSVLSPLTGKKVSSDTLVGVTDTQAKKSSYSVITYARSGIYGANVDSITSSPANGGRLPVGIGLFSSTSPFPSGISQVDEQSVGGLGGLTARDKYYVLRIVNPPAEIGQSDTTNDSGATPTILGPRPHAMPRGSTSVTISVSSWIIDNIMSAIPNSGAVPGGDWVESYIAAWESLATTHPVLGRKPALALKIGNRWWGIGSAVCYLESVGVNRNYYENGFLASATVDLRFTEVLF